MEIKKYDKVNVSPTATGLGEWLTGWVDDVSPFAGKMFVSVRYDRPATDGSTGIVVSNTGLLEKLPALETEDISDAIQAEGIELTTEGWENSMFDSGKVLNQLEKIIAQVKEIEDLK